MTKISAPMKTAAEPDGTEVADDQSTSVATRPRQTTARTPVTTVMTVCIRMIRSKPRMPPPTTRAATTSRATTLVAVPPPQPSWVKTVEVASVASETSTVSQPTVSTQDSAAGTRLPSTPNAARLRTSVGAEPRLPAIAMKPQSRKETTMPTTPATTACQNEMPKPKRNEP